MTWHLAFILVLVFGILHSIGDGISHVAPGVEKKACQGPESLVLASFWQGSIECFAVEAHSGHFGPASFQGRRLLGEGAQSNDLQTAQWLAVRDLQENEVSQRLVLRPVWTIMGCLRGSYQCPARASTARTRTAMAKQAHFLSREKSSSKNQAKIQKEVCQSGLAKFGRQLCLQERLQHGLVDEFILESACFSCPAYDGWQRFRQGFQSFAHADGLSSPASTTYVGRAPYAAWSSVATTDAATTSSSNAHDALHAAYGECCTSSSSDPSIGRCDRRAEEGEERTSQAQQDRQGCQKGRSLVSGIPGPRPCRDEEGRQGKYRRFVEGRKGARRCQGCSHGGGKGPHATLVAVARLPATVGQQVERVHDPISVVRGIVPHSNAGGHLQPQASAAPCGPCQETCRQDQFRRRGSPDFRRRHGRGRSRGRGRSATRRACSEDPRRIATSRHEFGRSLRVSRKTGTQGQKAAYKGRGGALWWQALCVAAFSQGRCSVTVEYGHQRPVDECSQWTHTILSEPSFLSPWQAIEQAGDLAIECGNWQSLRVDTFALPSRSTSTKPRVRFDESVLVFQGKGNDVEFLPHYTDIKDASGWPVPSTCAPDDQPAHTVRQGTSSSSTGGSDTPHFLDLRLPDRLPPYVHHLQARWHEFGPRLSPSAPYRLRTWYIHHEHNQVWKIPRVLALPPDPGLWHQDLLQLWRDQLHNDMVLNVAVVFPEVRALRQPNIHADLILTQGVHDRCGGLTSVFPPGSDEDGGYTWAVSYPRHLSGVEILRGVEADQILLSHACDVFHGGVNIPATPQPTHWMMNGHSFVAVFQDLAGDLRIAQSVSSSANTGTSLATRFVNDPPVPPTETQSDHADQQAMSSPEHENAESSSPASSSFEDEDLRGVRVFGLAQHPQHCFVRWTTYNSILADILHSLGLHSDFVIGFHSLQATLVDQHAAEEGVILQRVGDVPDGLPNQLCLVDIAFRSSMTGTQDAQRGVRLLPPHLCRQGLILELGLQQHCTLDESKSRCDIYHNNNLWMPLDFIPRTLQHGTYLRIVIDDESHFSEPQIIDTPVADDCHSGERPTKFSRRHSSSDASPLPSSKGLRLHQVHTQLRKHTNRMPVQHSASFPSLGYVHSQHAKPRSPLISRQAFGGDDWLVQARMQFLETAVCEFSDEGPVAYWTTWYLHHQRYPRNTESRTLRLDRHSRHWQRDIAALWAGVLDPFDAMQIFVVVPEPPAADGHDSRGHLLIVQGHSASVPVLVTAIFDHPSIRRMWQLAVLMPGLAQIADLCDTLNLQRWCNQRVCEYRSGAGVWEPDQLFPLQPGEGLQVTITQARIQQDQDVTTLMQTSSSATNSLPSLEVPDHFDSTLYRYGGSSILHRDQWLSDVQDYFARNHMVENDAEGPIIYIWTWHINHFDAPRCDTPRVLRLNGDASRWTSQLLALWHDRFHYDALTQISVLHPRPPQAGARIDSMHMLIEQNPSDGKAAVVISNLFHGEMPIQMTQTAYSLPRWLCTSDLIDVLEINPICDIQRCSARIGVAHFDKFIRHDVPSAASIEVHVQPVRCTGDPTASSAGDPYPYRHTELMRGASMVQTRKWTRRARQESNPQNGDEAPQDHRCDEYHQVPQRIAAHAGFWNDGGPLPAPTWPLHWSSLQEVWHYFFETQDLPEEAFIRAEVWYSDHVRRPWSEAGRVVQLGADFGEWSSRLQQVWSDWLLADQPCDIQVVKPMPISGIDMVHFHVILLQQPEPHQRSVLLTIMDTFADPWDPTHVCTVVPQVIDHWQLLREAVVEFQCPPIVPASQCRTLYGNLDLTAGILFPVPAAACFTVIVENWEQEPQLPAESDLQTSGDFHADAVAIGVQLLQTKAILRRCQIDHDKLPDTIGGVDGPKASRPFHWRAHCEGFTAQIQRMHEVWDLATFDDSVAVCHGEPLAMQIPEQSARMGSITKDREKPPVIISLQATLVPEGDPDLPAYRDELSTTLWLQDDNWAATCQSSSSVQPLPLPEGLHVPPETLCAFLDPGFVPPGADAQWELFVDGATTATSAGWSVVIVQAQQDCTVFVGQLSGQVALDSTAPDWIGALTVDNIAAEFTAFAVAAMVLHSGHLPGKGVIRPDLRLSREIACQIHSTESNQTLVRIIRLYALWLGQDLHIEEVRGHTHHPWNELADRIAKHAAGQDTPATTIRSLSPLRQLAIAGNDTGWAWMQQCPRSLLHAFPPLCEGQVMQFPLSLRKVSSIPSPDGGLVAMAPAQWNFDFNLVTANVLALDSTQDSKEVGRRVGVRTQRLDAQWHKEHVLFAGLQEARTPQGAFTSEHYSIWSSGPHGQAASCLGCELWCHRNLPILTSQSGAKLFLRDFKVVVQHADPRRLYVRFEHSVLRFSVVVLHVPCLRRAVGPAHRSIDDLQQWWDETAQLQTQCVHDPVAWYLVDANAPLATAATSSFGLHGMEPSNPQGQLFEAFLLEQKLVVPATFGQYHSGPSTTWTHPNGHHLRRDYVLVSPDALPFVHASRVMVDHDTTFEHEDHLPCGLQIRGSFEDKIVQPDRIQWDRDKLRDPFAMEAFQQAVATLPIPTWDVNVDDHCRIYEANLLQLARQHFERTSFTKPRRQLTEDTLQAIAFKRHVLDCGRRWGLMDDPTFKQELRAIEKDVRRKVYADLQVYYDQLLVRLQDAGDMNDFKEVYNTLARFGSRKIRMDNSCRPIPALRRSDGTLATSFTAQQQIWMQQFSEIEAGQQLHWQTLQELDRPGLGPPKDIQCQELFPSPWALQRCLRRLKRGKAPGLNKLPPDVLKAGAGPFCQQLCALTMKIVAHCKEPLSWKGGQLIPLSKGKPDSADPLGYRSIFLNDFTAKLFHMTMRDYLVEVWEKGITSLQLGGRRRRGVDLAHHLLQAHRHWAGMRKLPTAHLFFDIRSAFYSVLRQSLYPDDDPPLSLIAALRRFKVGADDIDHMVQAVRHDDATAGISDHFRLMLKDALTNTHFVIAGLDAPCRTTRGTRPGDPLGDLLYNMVMSLVMRDARDRTAELTSAEWIGDPGLCENFEEVGTLPELAFLDLAFVDDCAVAMHAPRSDDIIHMVQSATHAMARASSKRGLLLNYAPGKTEVVLNVIGPGSRACKERLHDQSYVLKWTIEGIDYDLRVVHGYKHLGTWFQPGNTITKEVGNRGTVARQSWGPLHRSFYSKRYVSIKTKMAVFQTLTLSRLLYNAHIWSPCPSAQLQRWQNMVRKPLGLLARGQIFGISPLELDVQTLCGILCILPPEDLLHIARLRYLRRLLDVCPQVLWTMLLEAQHQTDSWLAACSASFEWFAQFYSEHMALPQPHDLNAWITIIRLDPNWKGRVKTAARACRSFRQACAEAHIWRKRFEGAFTTAGGVLPDRPPQCSEKWTCDQCDRWFASKRALATHAAKKHGYRRLVALYAVGQECQGCCRLFHNRSRLSEHLRDSHHCLATLQACFPPVTDEQLQTLDAEELVGVHELRKDGWGAKKALEPMRRLHGPRLPPPGSAEAQAMKEKYARRQGSGSTASTLLQGRRADPVDHAPAVHVYEADFPAFVMNVPEGFQRGTLSIEY